MAAAADSADGVFASKAGRALAFACSFTVCLLAAGALAITLFGRPHGATITLDLPQTTRPKAVATATLPARDVPTIGPVTKPVFAGKALVADPALIENTAQGPLPRVALDGRKPMTAYAAPAASGKFKIAIVVGGLGISATATKEALDALPAGVTLGFAPYAGDVGDWVSQARARGHEVLLEVPMEPFDFPDSDPGPHTLRAIQDEDANIQRLNWALTRFTGYAGVTNLLGQRFLSDSDALSPTMVQFARRGLYFFDNDMTPKSAASDVAARSGTAFAKSTETLDDVQSALEIDRHLSNLEDEARAHGTAIGSGFLYPITVARIAAWAKGLEGRGFVLVPVSAIANPPQ
jgi:uncharacterized protein